MDKKELRTIIKALKKQHTSDELGHQSAIVCHKLEQHPDFIKAKRVMLYNALPDEVQTVDLIERWRKEKTIILPTVVGDDIVPVALESNTGFAVGDFNILEPQNEPYTGDFDLIVVPGVAFDPKGNRMGRGKGYYDRLLPWLTNAYKAGICFSYQIVDEVPVEPTDIAMDICISK